MLRKHPAERLSPPDWYEIAMYWRKQREFVDNILEPRCFACEWYPYGYHQPKCPRKAWRKRLQRAHIVARSAGGTWAPSNFLLLCERCHIEAPMTNDPRIMLQWAKEHETHLSIWYREFADAFSPVIDELGHLVRSGDTQRAIEFFKLRNVDFHYHSTHAERMQALAVVFRSFLKSKQDEQEPLFQ